MYNMKIKMKFVQLHAAGIPLYKISEEIGVHRTTLTMWHKELAEFILIAKQDIVNQILYENDILKIERVESLSRNLRLTYSKLDEPFKMGEKEISKILDNIVKFTKLLQMETAEKNMEQFFMKEKSKRFNIKTKEVIPEDSDDPFDEEAPIWVTNAEHFEFYQPEDDYEDNYGTNKDNALEVSPEFVADELDKEFGDEYLTDMLKAGDISDIDDTKVQQIFNKTNRRSHQEKQAAESESKKSESKPVKNSAKNNKSEKEKMNEEVLE